MKLPGRLAGTTLGDVLGLLHRERATGVLELVEASGPTAGRRHAIHLVAGLVADVESKLAVPRLGEILKAQGFVGDEALARLSRTLLLAPSRRAGDILRQDARIAPEVVSAALRRQLRLRDAELRFRVARTRSSPHGLPLSPREFLHGRVRARDRSGVRAAAIRARSGTERARARAFELLGVTPGAAREEVLRAFRRLAASVHPDRHPTASSNERAELLQRFAELSAAYHLLVA
jgi:DnaJ-domain-containing protein 1